MSKVFSVLLTVIVMIVLAGVGYYFLNQSFEDQKADLQKQITDLQSQIKTAQEALTDTSNTDTSNWKTYTNTTLGFTTKYPTNWTLPANLDGADQTFATKTSSIVNFYDPDTKSIELAVYKSDSDALTSTVSTFKALFTEPTETSSEIGDKTATKITGVIASPNQGAGKSGTYYIVDNSDLILVFKLSEASNSIVTQILDTFKLKK